MIDPELKDCGEVKYTYERMVKKTALLCVKLPKLLDLHVAESDGRRIRTARIKPSDWGINARIYGNYLMDKQAFLIWLN